MQHDIDDAPLDEFEVEDFPFSVHLCDEAVIIPRGRLPVHIGDEEFFALLVADEAIGCFQPGNLGRVEEI